MNGLYVAASRARRRLFVADKDAALDYVWSFAMKEATLNQILLTLPRSGGDWHPHCGLLAQGVAENWSDDRDDPKVLAERFREEGFRKEDAYLLRQAAIQYGQLKMVAEADKTPKNALREALARLEGTCSVIGMVLNKSSFPTTGGYGYYGYGGYGKQAE